MKYIYILQQAIAWIIVIYWLYQLIISACSLIQFKEKPLIKDKKHKFMMILPAHNESAVIGALIESLQQLDYPKELYDIYVIADNCTDNTAQIARDAGAIVLERFDEEKKTKGFALQWFLNQKIKEDADYDAFCVFDADNIVDKNFLNAMNKKLCQGEQVVQGYRDIKNPSDSWISAGYALFYWSMNRFYHLSRYNLGLSPLINGTGFMVGSPFQTTEHLIEDLRFIQELKPDMIGIGPYITHRQTPFNGYPSGSLELTLRMIAILRLMFPYVLIPATTALGTIDGTCREKGLKAGANVVMPNLSPVRVRKQYDLYDNKICTGEESAQCRGCLERRVNSAGYSIVNSRGDVKGQERIC